MRFRTLLLMGITLLVLGIVVAIVGSLTRVLDRSVLRELRDGLTHTQRAFEDLQRYHENLYQSQAQVVAEEQRLKEVFNTDKDNSEKRMSVAVDLQQILASVLFILTDMQGHVTVDTSGSLLEGTDLSKDATVVGALAKGSAHGIWINEGEAYQIHAQRLNSKDSILGLLIIGYPLDNEVAETIHRQTGSSIVLALKDRILARSSFETIAAKAQNLEGVLNQLRLTGEANSVNVGDDEFLAISYPYPAANKPADLRYVILRSFQNARATKQQLIELIYLIATLGVALAFGLTLGFSSLLTRPIDKLVAFTQLIASGTLEKQVAVKGPVEIRTLGTAMNRMTAELLHSRLELVSKQRLESEMEIAQRIQTSILPRILNVPGFDVAAAMLPASEVGGDYYDVLPTLDGGWIGVGDVAGHGLTAGLVMLMIQAAVSTLVRQNPNDFPSHIVCETNSILFENIRHRLRQTEHVTFTMMRFFQDGRFCHAGAHEDMLLRRASTGEWEELPTPGTWIGVRQDIRKHIKDYEQQMAPGDILVLYTDGVTELMDSERRMFGTEKLRDCIEANNQKTNSEIVDAALATMKQWSTLQDDDITLLIIRYLGLPDTKPVSGSTPQ